MIDIDKLDGSESKEKIDVDKLGGTERVHI